MKLPINHIKPNPNNPRFIKDDAFKSLVQSLKDFPEMADVREVVLNKEHVILGGNMRFRAMKEAGWTEIPVKIVDWPEDKQREFIVKDNVSGGEWDWDTLANEWDKDLLENWGLDLPVDFGESTNEPQEDEAPAVDETGESVSKLGEVYQLGRHRLMCGSATEAPDVERLMDGKKADMVFTDPPYGIKFSSNRALVTAKFDVLENDDVLLDGWVEIVKSASAGFVFVWTSWKVYSQWEAICKPFGDLSNVVVWDKGGGGIGDLSHTFSSDYELSLVYNRGNKIVGKRIGSVWSIGKDSPNLYQHPTQKPVALAYQAIQHTTTRENIVLDVFGGSGSTLIACEQTNRICYMMELDPKYVDVIRKRYWKFVNDGDETGWEENTPVTSDVHQTE